MALAWAPDREHMSDSYALSVARGLLYKSNLFLVLRKNLLNLTKYRRNKLDATREVNRVSLESFEENISGIIALARAADMQVVLIEMPHNPYAGGFASHRDPKYVEALRQIAARHADSDDVYYLDMYDVFWPARPKDGREEEGSPPSEAMLRKSKEYFVDDCHMTPVGHRIVAQHLASLFKTNKIIERALGR